MQIKSSGYLYFSARLSADFVDSISGASSLITGPVQTANTKNYGGDILNICFGVNLLSNFFDSLKKDRFAFEIIFPLSRVKMVFR